MRAAFLALLLSSGTLSGCDGFGRLDALPVLRTPETNPTRLVRDEGWLVVAVVSGGQAYRFPEEGYSVAFRSGGRVDGRVSANRYTGGFTASLGGAFEASDVVPTQTEDTPRNGRRADLYLRELHDATRFETDGVTLLLHAPDGDGIRFRLHQFIAE